MKFNCGAVNYNKFEFAAQNLRINSHKLTDRRPMDYQQEIAAILSQQHQQILYSQHSQEFVKPLVTFSQHSQYIAPMPQF